MTTRQACPPPAATVLAAPARRVTRPARAALAATGLLTALLLTLAAALLAAAAPAAAAPAAPSAATTSTPEGTTRAPAVPTAPATPTGAPGTTSINVDLGGKPSTSIVAILGLTLLAVAPAMLLLCTSFTKMIVVLSLTRNALGLTSVPPNQVLAGIALFLSLFVMGPILSQVNSDGVQPYLKGTKTQTQAFNDGMEPLREFMTKNTRSEEIALLTKAADRPRPKNPKDVPLTTLIPAFVLSELRAAFIIGFVIFIPFLIIDIVVSSSLMSMGMMMLPPVMISLPFKLLLFLLVDGWALIVKALIASYG
jgi:flagellar biosynthetic protein FliP